MRVKKYRAPDRATALKQIKAELGSDAMIVHEQSVRSRSGPLGLFGKPEVEITAAIEEEALAAARQERARGERPREHAPATRSARKAAAPAGQSADHDGVQATISTAGRRAASAAPAPVGKTGSGPIGADRLAAILAELPKNGESISPEMAARLADLVSQSADGTLGDLLQASVSTRVEAPAAAPRNGGAIAASPRSAGSARSNGTTAAAPDGAAGVLHDMQRTLADLRSAVERLTQQSQPAATTREAPALRTIYHRLMEQEVEPGMALDLMGHIADELDGDPRADAATVESRLLTLLRPLLPTRSLTAGYPAPTTGPRVVVLVGPTGVGKTTTVAKLAAHLSLDGRKRVCLVTTDTFRIAAAAQLGTYADIMRLPLEVVYAADELPEAISRHADVDYVIVDTPGCGQHNEPQLKELAGFVKAAMSAAPHATVLMAIAAPTKLSDMLEVQQRFGALDVDGIVLTKLDETRAFGPLLSVIRRAAKPVYYVTTGQNVPNDIAEASSDALAHLVAGALTPPAVPSTHHSAGGRA